MKLLLLNTIYDNDYYQIPYKIVKDSDFELEVKKMKEKFPVNNKIHFKNVCGYIYQDISDDGEVIQNIHHIK